MSGPLYVRIDKCSRGGSWYEKRVGQVLPVERVEINRHPDQGLPGDVYWCREGGTYNAINYVLQSDATVVDKSNIVTIKCDDSTPKPHILDLPASHWDGVERRAARAKNPNGWRLDSLDKLIAEERSNIASHKERIGRLMSERATMLNEEERCCNLFAAMKTYSDATEAAQAMTIQELAEVAFGIDVNATQEAVISEVLRRAGYVYEEEDESP